MVGSRHLQGTIISRMKYLLDSGSLKTAPIWYEVVRRFPPPHTSLLSLVEERDVREIPKITYPVDDLKREFFKLHFRAARDPTSLFEDIETPENKTDLFLKEYQKSVTNGCTHDEALKKSLSLFEHHLKTIREKSIDTDNDYKSNNEASIDDLSTSDIYDMFSSGSKKK